MKDILEHYVKNVIYTISEDLGTFQQVPNILVVLVSIIIKIQLLQQQQAYVFSIFISVKSNVLLNEKIIIQKIISIILLKKLQYHSNFGILIKMITNHLQIVSVIFTFKFKSILEIGNFINSISNPIQTMTHSLDCLLKDIFDIQIHYSRIIWQLIVPFIYIFLFFGLYGIALILKKLKYSLNVITTTIIYMYIYVQPFMVGGLISLISFRYISGFYWIQANVANRYDTQTHYQWLFMFCLPLLILISLIIPLYFLLSLYLNKQKFNKNKTRQKWGYLYNEYKLEAYYWEIIKILIKQFLIIFLSYYQEFLVKKGILLLSLQKISTLLIFSLNKLDAYSAKVCGISIAVGIGIFTDYENGSKEIQIPYYIILIAFNLQYFKEILKEILSSFYIENYELVDSMKKYIIKKLPKIQKYSVFKKLLQDRSVQKNRIKNRYLKIKKYLMVQAKNNITSRSQHNVKIISSISFLSNAY
ncbi:unnamed protein product [Paramecium primaurelia]|uniref:Transmembrane protein n=1 Tax=Paramecium primaurelia TaxID=5886 RepID=A0A8S1Q0C9_PARPR|nr:unnamed protein product [Paramecium primaurelia]